MPRGGEAATHKCRRGGCAYHTPQPHANTDRHAQAPAMPRVGAVPRTVRRTAHRVQAKKSCKIPLFELKYRKPSVSVVENPSQVRAKGST